MKFTKMFTKTKKESKEFDSTNATLLIKAGFIDQTMAGVYTFLPLGLRTLSKIENIVRDELNKVAEEVLMPALAPTSLWEQTGRIDTVDVLYKVTAANEISKAKNDATYILNCTQEDVVTPIAQKFNMSYKDLSKAVFQIQNKFRNEARPKSGIMRGREFRMKDMYSFHTSEAELLKFYEAAKEVYARVYERLGLGEITNITLASGGDFTKEFSHEFQTKCDFGEDTIFYAKSIDVHYNKEIAPSRIPQDYDATEELKEMKKIDTPNITGVEALAKFLDVPVEKTVKTLIYETENGVVAVAVRGDYEVNDLKLKPLLDCKKLELAKEEIVKEITNAEIGYAGIINLPEEVKVIIDDSLEGLINFECGANETNTHLVNVNWDRDLGLPEKFYDVKTAKEGDLHPETLETYEIYKASEVGNIFPLNTKYSEAFNYTYTDEKGEENLVYMGSYGIGTTRIMGVIVEVFNDEKGIIWPKNIAPYQVHLIGLNMEDDAVSAKAQEIYETLTDAGIEVLFDDRIDTRAGEKFADAELIGCPLRAIVSKKTADQIELKERSREDTRMVGLDQLVEEAKTFFISAR